jgi:putative membrane protein
MSTLPNTETAARFQVRTTAETHFAWLRTRMSVERTLMSWLRTAVSLIGFGFTIVQFFERFSQMSGVSQAHRPQAPRQLGLTLIGIGVLVLIVSTLQYRRTVLYLNSQSFETIRAAHESGRPVILQTPLMLAALILMFVGVFAFLAVLVRWV